MNNRFRIYALIHGPILPIGKLFNLEIKKMTFEEQDGKNFAPLQSVFSRRLDAEHRTYVTSLPYVDPMRIKSEHVIICNIKETYNENSAVGAAIKQIDRLCRYLSIANLRDTRKKLGEKTGILSPYVYQINKVYVIDSSSNEIALDLILESGYVSQPDRPEMDHWRDTTTSNFLDEIYKFHDEILERSLKYLYRSSIGRFMSDSPEKIALDHFKSIEIIINSLSNKREFKDRLDESSKKIELTAEEKIEIVKFWNYRSEYGDIAHPSKYDQVERYPNQFPIPSNVNYPWAFISSIAADVCLKYYQHKRDLFLIEIDEPFDWMDELGNRKSGDGVLSEINPHWESNHFCFHTSERNKKILKQKVKTVFAKEHNKDENNIKIEFGATRKTVTLRVNSE